MDKWKKYLGSMDKKKLTNLVVLMILGIALLSFGTFFGTASDDKTEAPVTNEVSVSGLAYEEKMSVKLSEALSKVEGVGQVEIVITVSYGKEIVVAEEETSDTSQTKETASDGATRDVSSQSYENKKVLIQNSSGNYEPLVLKEISPKIEGVLVVAQGGGDPSVKSAITQATTSLFNIEAHKVTVLKMK